MKTSQTKVIFRRFHNGEVIALFPQLAGTMDAFTCLSYQTIGQHGSASVDLTHCTRLAKADEYAELSAELRRLGYDLHVARRFTSADLAERRTQITPSAPIT
jgi:hypothetical protein